VELAIQTAFTRVGPFDWQALPPHSLLGVVQGRAAVPPRQASVPEPERGFVIDRDRFEVRYNGVPCELRNTKEFAFIERLHRARGVYLPIATLGRDVWDNPNVLKNTV
jgi:hypothetical protein